MKLNKLTFMLSASLLLSGTAGPLRAGESDGIKITHKVIVDAMMPSNSRHTVIATDIHYSENGGETSVALNTPSSGPMVPLDENPGVGSEVLTLGSAGDAPTAESLILH